MYIYNTFFSSSVEQQHCCHKMCVFFFVFIFLISFILATATERMPIATVTGRTSWWWHRKVQRSDDYDEMKRKKTYWRYTHDCLSGINWPRVDKILKARARTRINDDDCAEVRATGDWEEDEVLGATVISLFLFLSLYPSVMRVYALLDTTWPIAINQFMVIYSTH